MSKIQETLETLYKEHRVIFWYNNNNDFESEYNSLEIDRLKKLKLDNNEFQIKYQVLVAEPENKFLIYSPNPKPDNEDNWLLDLNLAFYEFSADHYSMYTQELELPIEMKYFIQKYFEFFKSQERREKLKKRNIQANNENELLQKMLAVITRAKGDELEYILFELFSEEAEKIGKNNINSEILSGRGLINQTPTDDDLQNISDNPKNYNLSKNISSYESIKKFELEKDFWKLIERKYNYHNDKPTLKDFIIELFENKFNSTLPDSRLTLNSEASVLVTHWMDSNTYQKAFEILSEDISKKLKLRENTLITFDYKKLINADVYKDIEVKIIADMVEGIVTKTLTDDEVKNVVTQRRNKYWYKNYENIYQSLLYTSELRRLINSLDLEIKSFKDGFNTYVKTFYEFDYTYRKCIYHFNKAEDTNILKHLSNTIESLYSNSYLLKLNDNWQKYIDNCTKWEADDITLQRNFYKTYVDKFVKRGNRIFVIICDALRYESAVELNKILMEEGKYQSNINSMLSMLPSYTQLGIASLLPNNTLTFDNESDTVFVDHMNSASTNREKILQHFIPRSTYITSKDLLDMKTEDSRKFITNYDVIYIYENKIDATGDHAKLESDVFEATEAMFDTIKRLVKKIISSKGTNILITADHGYIYQNKDLDDSEFGSIDKLGKIYKSNRRFIIGKNLIPDSPVKMFTAKELNIDDDTEFLIPKSIKRLRVQGGGNKFVHGGASLQEIVIPVIELNKNEDKEIKVVDVDVIEKPSKITANRQSINFYQTEPVKDKILPIEIKAGFYGQDGQLISNEVKMTFDFTNEDSRMRVKREMFEFKDTSKYNKSSVTLKLESLVEGSRYTHYNDYNFPMFISFVNDFDDI
ncbi:MAG: BREX-1 system phosphatase PglZ type A [Candidatus Sericytochromatia bacterium]